MSMFLGIKVIDQYCCITRQDQVEVRQPYKRDQRQHTSLFEVKGYNRHSMICWVDLELGTFSGSSESNVTYTHNYIGVKGLSHR
jgi:hypothetical protein